MTAQTFPLSATLALVCSFATNAAPVTEDSDPSPFCAFTIDAEEGHQNQSADRIDISSGLDDSAEQPAITTADIIEALIVSELDPPDFYMATDALGVSEAGVISP